MVYTWMGIENWFIRSQTVDHRFTTVMIPIRSNSEQDSVPPDAMISLCRLVPVESGVITRSAASIQPRGMPMPAATCALVPACGFFSLFAADEESVNSILAGCPSLPPQFPSHCSFMRLRRMVDEIKGMLLSCTRVPNLLPSQGVALEVQHRQRIYEMEARCFLLSQLLYRIGTISVLAGSVLAQQLALDCGSGLGSTTAKVAPEVVEQIRCRKKQMNWCMMQSMLVGHSPSGHIGTLAGSQADAVIAVVQQFTMDFAVLLQMATQSGFDVWEIHSFVSGTGPSDLLHLHELNLSATLGAHQSLLNWMCAYIGALDTLDIRKASAKKIESRMSVWDIAYLDHILLWADHMLTTMSEMTSFALATEAPEISGRQRRLFCKYLLQSVGTALCHNNMPQ